ncbi:short chain dehydrogenase/reductase [Saccharata proteae CBS 121410]|uniref:Short chain dehydrogenase/reductase n=1 Tax=Saccharata proteae CBS 121410 TaxID=1314787 RepID=A0A9P4LV47_9PEZI|nr:short chain dehydrogenase/reductase [Saccharata proteae CBS 121410]
MFAEPVFYALGVSTAVYTAYKFLSFIRIYLRSSDLPRYLRPDGSAWALVTGASDGIGASIAAELCTRGFNIVLHGRNPTKLSAVRDRLLKANPTRQVSFAIADASLPDADIQAVVDAVKDKNLTVLVNNVGGIPMTTKIVGLASDTADRVDALLNLNVRFPVQLTRALLPQLQTNKPALIINLSSVTSEVGMPWGSVYSGSKAFNAAWNLSLGMELGAENRDVEVMGLNTGPVNTGGNPGEVSLMTPEADAFAKAALNMVGCGREVVAPWWPHAAGEWLMKSMPKGMRHGILVKEMRKWDVAYRERVRKGE